MISYYTNEHINTKDEELKKLVKGLLEKDFTKRLTMKEIKNNKWITKNGKYPIFQYSNKETNETKENKENKEEEN